MVLTIQIVFIHISTSQEQSVQLVIPFHLYTYLHSPLYLPILESKQTSTHTHTHSSLFLPVNQNTQPDFICTTFDRTDTHRASVMDANGQIVWWFCVFIVNENRTKCAIERLRDGETEFREVVRDR